MWTCYPASCADPALECFTASCLPSASNSTCSALVWRQGGLSMEEAWRLFPSKSWPQGVWRMDRQGSWHTISITSNSLVTEVPIIQGGRSLPHHSTTLGNCIGLINIYGRFSLSWKCNVFRYHCNYFVVLSGVGNCMGLESCDCHDEKKRIKNAHCIVCAQACGSRT